jgi:hypothetical protein
VLLRTLTFHFRGPIGFCLFSSENFRGVEQSATHQGGIGICVEHLLVAGTSSGTFSVTAALPPEAQAPLILFSRPPIAAGLKAPTTEKLRLLLLARQPMEHGAASLW